MVELEAVARIAGEPVQGWWRQEILVVGHQADLEAVGIRSET